MSTPSFLDYAPVSLAFGTSGLRGLVSDITDLETYINVKGTLGYLLDGADIPPGGTVTIAGDLRPSSARITAAAVKAIRDAGCEVEHAGLIPTPALLAHTLRYQRAGVMITGSHIPFDRNGIKINKSRGEVLKSDEAGITRAVEAVRAEEYAQSAESSKFDRRGMLKEPVPVPALSGGAEAGYVQRYVEAFASNGLAGRCVAVYQHSAVGRDLLPKILRELGADVVEVGRAQTFIPIDTENITDAELENLEQLVVAAELASAKTIEALVSTDGDSDRPLVTAILPAGSKRRVQFLSGDLLGLIVAKYVGADAAVVPISANDAVERSLNAQGVHLKKSRIGSPYVVAGMQELARAGQHKRIVGWEANGGFLTGSELKLEQGTLRPLPSRDSVLPILANLYAAAERKIGLADLWSELPARYGRAGLLDNLPVAVGRSILANLVKSSEPAELELAGTMLSPETRATISRFFNETNGFDQVARINRLDGVRIYFQNGDIAHIRPSGNAPQLRIYANADTQARADEIVALGLREPDGILRSLERAFS